MATTATNDIVTTIGVDLGKNVFHLIGMNARGAVIFRERLSRAKLPRRLANMTSCLIGMEPVPGPITSGGNSRRLVMRSA